MAISIKHHGNMNDQSYRVYYEKDGQVISPFHDIPLFADKDNNVFNMVCEIPRNTNAKMEINTKQHGNPIKQDVKNGNLRFVHDVYPHTGYLWNYGAFPQTWEDPTHTHPETKAKGDNDPLDVCEIGQAVAVRGQIKQVKALGCIALIDEGETDWKVICIDINDPLADKLNDIDDVEEHMPGFIFSTYEWFRTYKMPAGKPANEFAFNGEAKNREFTHQVIEENYNFWRNLITGKTPAKGDGYEIAVDNATVEDSPFKTNLEVSYEDFVEVVHDVSEYTAEGVEGHVIQLQRNHPHGRGALSKVLNTFATNNNNVNVDEVKAEYTVHSATTDGWTTVGIYQEARPNSNNKTKDNLELVAAAAVNGNKFQYNSGYGTFSFEDGNLVDNFEVPKLEGDELAVTLPLSLL
jgi:inorganic pyrophosphatase